MVRSLEWTYMNPVLASLLTSKGFPLNLSQVIWMSASSAMRFDLHSLHGSFLYDIFAICYVQLCIFYILVTFCHNHDTCRVICYIHTAIFSVTSISLRFLL